MHLNLKVDLNEFIEFCKVLHQGEKNGLDTSNNITMTFKAQQELAEKGANGKNGKSSKSSYGGSASLSRGRGVLMSRKTMSTPLTSSSRMDRMSTEADEFMNSSNVLKNASDEWRARTSAGMVCLFILLSDQS